VAGATDPKWWSLLWDTTPPEFSNGWLGATHLVSTDITLSRRLFEDVLGGQVVAEGPVVQVSRPGGCIGVRAGAPPGIAGIRLHASLTDDLVIGDCMIGNPS
jgi:hypothetical protein